MKHCGDKDVLLSATNCFSCVSSCKEARLQIRVIERSKVGLQIGSAQVASIKTVVPSLSYWRPLWNFNSRRPYMQRAIGRLPILRMLYQSCLLES